MLNIVANYHCMQVEGKCIIQNSRKWCKTLFLAWFVAIGLKFGRLYIFSKIWHYQSLDTMDNDPILRKFGDGRTDGETNESDFIGQCPTDAERPTYLWKTFCLVKWALFEQNLIWKVYILFKKETLLERQFYV